LQSAYIWPIQYQLVNWSMTQPNALFSPSSILSIGEMASLLHPATGRVAKAEDVQTNKSSLLPLPTPLKVRPADSGVVIGSAIGSFKNHPIVITDDGRSRHM